MAYAMRHAPGSPLRLVFLAFCVPLCFTVASGCAPVHNVLCVALIWIERILGLVPTCATHSLSADDVIHRMLTWRAGLFWQGAPKGSFRPAAHPSTITSSSSVFNNYVIVIVQQLRHRHFCSTMTSSAFLFNNDRHFCSTMTSSAFLFNNDVIGIFVQQ